MAGAAGLVLSWAPAHAGDDKDKLEWKAFDEKAPPFYQVLMTKTVQTMKIMGVEIKQEQNQTFFVKWTPGKPKDGNWCVAQKIIGVKMDIDIGGTKIPYDSTTEGAPKNPMSEFFDTLTKGELKFYIDPKTFTVKEIEGQKEFVKKLTAASPQMATLLNNILSEDALKQMAEPTWAAFPTEEDKKKDTFKKDKSWTRTNELNLGPIGTYKFSNTYTWGDKDKVTTKCELTYEAPKKTEGLPFVIKKGDLKSTDCSGYAQFDRKAGRFKDSKVDMKLKGELTIEIGGTETRVELEQTQVSTVETRDDDPIEAMKKAKKQ
jgi:hypothetical protein